MSDTTAIEKKSLEAHVELCAERYRALESQFMEVKQDIADVKDLAVKTHTLVNKLSEKRNTQLINWGTGIIVFLLGIIGYLVKFHIQ
jgi:hypothetical protein